MTGVAILLALSFIFVVLDNNNILEVHFVTMICLYLTSLLLGIIEIRIAKSKQSK